MSEIDETIARNGTHDAELPDAEAVAMPDTDEAEPAAMAEASSTIGDDGGALAAPDVTPGFLSELSGAMRSVVGRERDRIATIVRDDATAHTTQAREQSVAEAEAFRRVADEDVAAIDAWAEQEIARIRDEAAQRVADRRADLEAYLTQHAAVLEGELEGIERAVGTYEEKLGAFLDELDATDDPALIAERAHALPRPPDLETVRSLARADALTRLAEASMANDPTAEVTPVDEEATAAIGVGAEGEADAEVDATGSDDAEVPALAHADGAPGDTESDADLGWGRPAADADAVAADAVDIGLGAMVDEAVTDRPVAVMDPLATSETTWPTPEPSLTPVGVARHDDGPGHPNAAVRLIRSVAPWTAPNHDGDDRPTQPG